MQIKIRMLVLALGWASLLGSADAESATVKVTPLGSHDGEFCRLDRARVFEDPDGTRLLYDPGRTVAGASDPRLGKIDVVLVSHMHGDHVGDKHIAGVNIGTCAVPEFEVAAVPNTNAVNITLAKGSKIITGSEMPRFFAGKLKSLGGNPKNSQLVRFGGSKAVGGVVITTVPAAHSNGVNPAFLSGSFGEMLEDAGLTAYAGPPTGYVLRFSNGLSVYLFGDTGTTAEQDLVVRKHYGAQLVVINIGDTFTTGPTEAAFVVNELVKPAAVIVSHANEAATQSGEVLSGSRTEKFIKASRVVTHVPLSGRTMEFDANARCVAGC